MNGLRRTIVILAICLNFCLGPLQAADEPTMDDAFARARELAFAGQREQARALCREILEEHPDAYEVKTLLGRTYAWDKQYDEARRVLGEVLDERPDDLDARLALIDVELWSDHPQEALRLADEGMRYHPLNDSLYFRQARAYNSQEMLTEALAAAKQAADANRQNRPAVKLYRRILEQTQLNRISVVGAYSWFNDSTDPWYLGSVDYRRFMPWGSLIGRVNVAHRFGRNGTQFEVDAYPDLARNTYAYLNVGVSSGDLFPKLRYGAEVWHNFPDGWEGSLGFRRLDFDSNDVTIWTGSVAKYIGRYWIMFRPQYVTKTSGRSFSARVQARYFFNGRREFVEVAAGGGAGSDNTPIAQQEDLNQRGVRFQYRRRIADSWILRGGAAWRYEDLDALRDRDSIVLEFGFDHLF